MKQKKIFGYMIVAALIAIILLGSSPISAAPFTQSATQTRTATATTTITPTNTLVLAAPTSTVTPTIMSTAVPPTAARTITPTATLPTPAATAKPTATITPTAVVAPTAMVTKTATITPTAVVTKTATVAPTATVTRTATITPTATVTKTATATPAQPKALAPRAGTVASLSTVFAVQNMDPSTNANVNATFYAPDGTTPVGSGATCSNLLPNRSCIVDQRLNTGGLIGQTNWQGSVVLSSNTQLAAMVNQFAGTASSLGTDFRYDTYTGVSSATAATSVLLPQLLKNVPDVTGMYNSTIAIQNTSPTSASANVTITYTNRWTGGTQHVHVLPPIPYGSSAIIDLQTETSTPAFPSSFFGSAVVTSDQPIGVVVNQNASGKLMTYIGYIGANQATTLYVSQILRNVYDAGMQANWGTAMVAVSVDGSAARVGVAFTNRWTGRVTQESYVANPTANIDQRNDVNLEDPFYGSAVIFADKPIVLIVNMVTDVTAMGGRAMSYRGFSTTTGATTIYLPQLLKNYYDSGTGVVWGTGVAGTLVGSSSGSATITYYCGSTTVSRSASFSPSSPTISFDQRTDPGIPSGSMCSGVIASTQPIVVTVNTVGDSSAPGDASGNYAGVVP